MSEFDEELKPIETRPSWDTLCDCVTVRAVVRRQGRKEMGIEFLFRVTSQLQRAYETGADWFYKSDCPNCEYGVKHPKHTTLSGYLEEYDKSATGFRIPAHTETSEDAPHPWQSARDEFMANELPLLRKHGMEIGRLAVRADNAIAKSIVGLYNELRKSFDPITYDRLKAALKLFIEQHEHK